MSSGQWEVVGKKNKTVKGLLKDPKKNKKATQHGPKVEEVLPVSQIKSLFKADRVKENDKKPKENGPKKQKKPENNKPPESQKQKPAKNIESALTLISASEFKEVFESMKNRFPDMPMVWLKELEQFLNSKLSVASVDPVFKNKASGYPLSVIPTAIKSVIDRSIKDAGKANAQNFFNISLSAMATDMSRGSAALGHKLFLQFIALNEPKLVAANLNSYITLRNSYQNRPPIGLSILWAVGQVGEKDFHLGLKVFNELMLPLFEMKNYSRYIVDYLMHLLQKHKTAVVTKDEFLLLLETVFSKKKYPTDVLQQLKKLATELRVLFGRMKETKSNIFVETLLKKLSEADNHSRPILCEMLVNCLVKDQNSFASWSKIYDKNIIASTALIKYISNNWAALSKEIDTNQLRDTFTNFSNVNDELSKKKRKEAGLNEVISAIQKLQKTMTVEKKSSSFPFKKLSILLALIIGGLVYYDCNVHGSWGKSRTQLFLHQLGVCKYGRQAVESVKGGFWAADKYAQENYPEYYRKTIEFSQPYVQLSRDVGLVVYNQYVNLKEYVLGKYPIVLETIELYAPGLIQQSKDAVNRTVSLTVSYYNWSVDYLKNEVFVGHLSPENMQKVVKEAFNTTQQKAVEYYQWLYEKVRVTVS